MADESLVAVANSTPGAWLIYLAEDALYRAHIVKVGSQKVFQIEPTRYRILSSNDLDTRRVYFRDISLPHSRWCGQDPETKDEIRDSTRIALLERILNCCRAKDPAGLLLIG